jgi:diguanylate cyclase (GGDEF)-like protein
MGMTAYSRITTLLQSAERPLAEQPGITDADLLRDNQALSIEVATLRLRVQELERMADSDPMLNVYNRRAFMREIRRAQIVMSRYDFVSSIIFFDLDGFKAVNDRYGHVVGDQILQNVSAVLLAGVRECDMVARLGGDEFGVLLFKTTPDVAKAKAEVLSCRVNQVKLAHPDGGIGVSVSWGVAPCEPDDTPESVLDRADRAMYFAKENR